MNLDELIEALIDLKQSGKAVDKLPVQFRSRKGNISIDRVKVYADSNNSLLNHIELISLD